jgi:hypothetical protein
MVKYKWTAQYSEQYKAARRDCITTHRLQTAPAEVERLDAIAESHGYNWYEDPDEHPEIARRIASEEETRIKFLQRNNGKEHLFESSDDEEKPGNFPSSPLK